MNDTPPPPTHTHIHTHTVSLHTRKSNTLSTQTHHSALQGRGCVYIRTFSKCFYWGFLILSDDLAECKGELVLAETRTRTNGNRSSGTWPIIHLFLLGHVEILTTVKCAYLVLSYDLTEEWRRIKNSNQNWRNYWKLEPELENPELGLTEPDP